MITEHRYNAIRAALAACTRVILTHARLRPGHVFRPRFVPRALRMSKSERRHLLTGVRSHGNKAPRPLVERKYEQARRRRRDNKRKAK